MAVKLRSQGRGASYAPLRGVLETVLRVLFTGRWPARLWDPFARISGVRVIRHTRPLPPGSGERCRMAFLSDLHIGPTTPDTLLDRAFEAVRSERPDVLLLGGDYVFLDVTSRSVARIEQLVQSVECPTKLAVMGNHDLWTRDDRIVAALQDAGATVLMNQAYPLPAPWNDVAVVGLDDPWTGHRDAASAFAQLNGEAFRIVLCHSPDGLLQLSGRHLDIYLCGHTHGGQVATPWGPIVVSEGVLCRRLSAGLAQFESKEVFVSRGIGGVELPIRTWAPPDVMVLDLVRPTS
jgi:predicted MPP superfamily phosphohydrolase